MGSRNLGATYFLCLRCESAFRAGRHRASQEISNSCLRWLGMAFACADSAHHTINSITDTTNDDTTKKTDKIGSTNTP